MSHSLAVPDKDDNRTSKETRDVLGKFRFIIGGEAYDKPHEPGDLVPENIPKKKLTEWLREGVIEPTKEKLK